MREDQAKLNEVSAVDYHRPETFVEMEGMIYAALQFSTGKFYVGQTINTVSQRAREH